MAKCPRSESQKEGYGGVLSRRLLRIVSNTYRRLKQPLLHEASYATMGMMQIRQLMRGADNFPAR